MEIQMEKWRPYIKMLRLGHQSTAIVVLLFAAMDAGFLQTGVLLRAALGLLLWSISIFVVNEYVDAKDTDNYSTRQRVLTKTKVSPRVTLLIWLFLTAAAAALLLPLGLWWQFLTLLILGNLYSLPPFRFKATFPWDLLSLEGQFLAAYSLPWQLAGRPITDMFALPFLILNLVLGLAEFIHLITDIEADKKAGLQNAAAVIAPNNLLRLAKTFLIASAAGMILLVYHHSHWWYYPLAVILPYVGYAIGRLREAMYEPKKLTLVLNTAYNRGVNIGNLLVLYQIVVLVYLTRLSL